MKYLIKYTDGLGPLFYTGTSRLSRPCKFDTYKHAALFFTKKQADQVLSELFQSKNNPNYEFAEVISTSDDIDIKVDPSAYYNYYMQVSQNQTGSYSQAEFVEDVNENVRFFIPSDDLFNRRLRNGLCEKHQQFEVWLEEMHIYDYAGIKDAADCDPSKQKSVFFLTLAKILEDLNQEQL